MITIRYFYFFLLIIFIANCTISNDPCLFSLNPDVGCRVLDEKSDGTKLVEFFNRDTNKFRLVLKNSSKEVEIEHPYGKVENFNEKVETNKIQFDSKNPQNLIVNGQNFAIALKE